MRKELLDRLLNLCIPEPNSGCWLWLGTTSGPYPYLQYGRMYDPARKKSTGAHRISFEIFKGQIPPNMEVCHSCDNSYCVNPDHLWVGTKQDNMDDRERKGRNKLAFGEKNGQAKLTNEMARQIRDSRERTGVLKRRFGVSRWTIARVRAGRQFAAPSASPREPIKESEG